MRLQLISTHLERARLDQTRREQGEHGAATRPRRLAESLLRLRQAGKQPDPNTRALTLPFTLTPTEKPKYCIVSLRGIGSAWEAPSKSQRQKGCPLQRSNLLCASTDTTF